MSTPSRTRWDAVRADKRRDASAGMPRCSICSKPSVLDPCRACAAEASAPGLISGDSGAEQ